MKPTATARVHEAAQLQQLATRVCLQAFRDLNNRDRVTALDAFLWLTGPDFGFWAEMAGIPFGDPLAVLTNGRLSEKRVRYAKYFAIA